MDLEEARQQVEKVIRFTSNGKTFTRAHETFPIMLQWVTNFPMALGEGKRRQLIEAICHGYTISEAELYAAISGTSLPAPVRERAVEEDDEREFEGHLPKGGWFEDYCNFTRQTESPLSYHVFCSIAALGACLGRRAFKEKGHFRIYPNPWIILVGPPGRVRKTSAIDIAKTLVHKSAACPIMADKITPEALVIALQKQGGHHFIYAPEFSVLFGKQKYNEGLTTLFLRLADCPESIQVDTVARGPQIVDGVALTMLGGSTMSLLAGATPEETTSSGFLSRCVLVVENDTKRCFPEPSKGSSLVEKRLYEVMERMKAYGGACNWESAAVHARFSDWYRGHKEFLRAQDNETMAESLERLDIHMERFAMITHLAECGNNYVCQRCLDFATYLVEWVRNKMPQTVSAITQTLRSQDAEYVLACLRKMGGAVDHSRLLRRCSSRMDATLFKRAMGTLTESKQVRAEKRGAVQFYIVEEVISGTTR